MRATGNRSPTRAAIPRAARRGRDDEGNGRLRSPRCFRSAGIPAAFWLLLLLLPHPAAAQLEVLLRAVEPTRPRPGACGLYRFEADEPSGHRSLEFHACIEKPTAGAHSVTLHLWSGDSLDARIEVDSAMFLGQGGTLIDHVRSVVTVEKGETKRLEAEDWQKLPALAPAPKLPVVADSSLGTMKHAPTHLECQGRLLEEARTTTRKMGDADVTQSEHRVLRIWTAPEAPILGVVHAAAVVRSERSFSQPIPGVPQRGPRESRYELELLALEGDGRPNPAPVPRD